MQKGDISVCKHQWVASKEVACVKASWTYTVYTYCSVTLTDSSDLL